MASKGEYNSALNEANEILQHDLNNSGALLIKGRSLLRRKAFGDAIETYRTILEQTDDFDARLGLTYSLLAVGQKQEAEEQFKLLHPQDEWQQSDLKELARNIDVNVRPVIEYMNTTFSDSDNYEGVEQDFNARGNIADWDLSLSSRHRTTSGDGIFATADTGIAYVGTNISQLVHVLVGYGVSQLSWRQETSAEQQADPFKIGEFRLNAQIWNGTAQLSYTNQVLTANAYLINNVVGMERAEVSYNKSLNNAFTVKAKYRNSEYSDDNSAQEFEGLMLLTLNTGPPQFSLGYSYHYLNYSQPSTQGYFDPQNYKADKLMILAAYEHGPFYFYAESVVGDQSYNHKQQNQNDFFYHVGITTGTTLWRGFRVEISAENNNSDAELSDYAYGDSSISWRLSYSL